MAKMSLNSLYLQIMGLNNFAPKEDSESVHFEFPSIYEEVTYQTTTIEHLETVPC